MGDHKQLDVWKRAHTLTIGVYRAIKVFPAFERFGLASQLSRAVVSIESNLAEGCGRGRDGELRRSLTIARGSTHEVECQVLIARDLGYIDHDTWSKLDQLAGEISRMLLGLRNALGRVPRP